MSGFQSQMWLALQLHSTQPPEQIADRIALSTCSRGSRTAGYKGVPYRERLISRHSLRTALLGLCGSTPMMRSGSADCARRGAAGDAGARAVACPGASCMSACACGALHSMYQERQLHTSARLSMQVRPLFADAYRTTRLVQQCVCTDAIRMSSRSACQPFCYDLDPMKPVLHRWRDNKRERDGACLCVLRSLSAAAPCRSSMNSSYMCTCFVYARAPHCAGFGWGRTIAMTGREDQVPGRRQGRDQDRVKLLGSGVRV